MDELEISGKRYISTRRAGKDHKYHADYIGQLIRARKVEGKKVGRAWYVDADSLAEYLGREAPAHAPLAHKEEVVEVAMPIVTEQDEKEQEQEMAKELPVVESVEKEKIQTIATEVAVEEKIEHAPLIYKTTREAREAHLPAPAIGGLRYIADDGPLIPPVKKTVAPEESVIAIRHGEPQPIPVRLESTKVQPIVYPTMAFTKPQKSIKKNNTAPFLARGAAVLVLGAIVFAVAGLLSTHLLFTLTVDGGQSASVGYSIK